MSLDNFVFAVADTISCIINCIQSVVFCDCFRDTIAKEHKIWLYYSAFKGFKTSRLKDKHNHNNNNNRTYHKYAYFIEIKRTRIE
jgi:hypothetical protein